MRDGSDDGMDGQRAGHRTSATRGGHDERRAQPGRPAQAEAPTGFRVSYPAMQAPQGPRPRTRSAFAAAFLSLIFPGLGHAYAGAPMRAIGFAAPPLLAFALLGGVAIRSDRMELLGTLIQPDILWAIFIVNIAFAIYRTAPGTAAWRVPHHRNALAASGSGRLGPSRLPLSPISIAGMGAVILVLLGGHVAVARYDQLAMSLVD